MIPGDDQLLFLPLGGCGEIGMNMNLFGHAGRWLMVDCGITFERHGDATCIELPDPAFIEEHRDSLLAIVLTHAHEDHIGAVSLLWPRLKVPVYATPFAAEVLRRKAPGRGGALPLVIHECMPNSDLELGPFRMRWIPITHSTPETCALYLQTDAGNVLHTADWKIDGGPVVGPAFDATLFQRIGKKRPDAVVCDSTNALRPGASPSEEAVAQGLRRLIDSRSGRVVVACFASNVARLVSLAAAARACDRYAGLLGRSLETIRDAAAAAGLLPPAFNVVDAAHLGYLPRKEVLAIATGSQGEAGAALARLAADTHPALSLQAGDTVIMSARAIPGNEESIGRLREQFLARDIEVLESEDTHYPVHASGHPCAAELLQMYQWLCPRVAVPVHGEEAHMQANAGIAREAGVPLAMTGHNGDLFYLAPEPGVRRRAVRTGRLLQRSDGALIPRT